jgi:hypothetical protein
MISTFQVLAGHYEVCTVTVCMANKKANKKVSAKAIKQQPRSEAPKGKARTKVTPCPACGCLAIQTIVAEDGKGCVT